MKIYLLCNPQLNSEFARFSHLGTWTDGKLCEECGQPTSKLIEPLKIVWEPDSSYVGDFSWCGYIAVITEAISHFLISEKFEINLGSVRVEPPSAKTKKKIVPFPYTGPKLEWLIPSDRINANERKSNIDLLIDCQKCGQSKYTFKRNGIFIDSENWKGQKIFCIEQFTRARTMFVTEDAKNIILSKNVSNISFLEAGTII